MQFLDDLDLKSSIFLNKHYVVSHKTRTDSTKDSNCMNYFIKKRNPVSQAEKHWSFGLSIADSVTFDFNESVWIDLGPKLSEKKLRMSLATAAKHCKITQYISTQKYLPI